MTGKGQQGHLQVICEWGGCEILMSGSYFCDGTTCDWSGTSDGGVISDLTLIDTPEHRAALKDGRLYLRKMPVKTSHDGIAQIAYETAMGFFAAGLYRVAANVINFIVGQSYEQKQ